MQIELNDASDNEDLVKYSIVDGYMNGYPTCVQFDTLPEVIDQSLCNLPYRPSNKITPEYKIWNYNDSKFNGYLSSIVSQQLTKNKFSSTNLPLKIVKPISKSAWQIKSDILDGYPSPLRLDPTVDYNPEFMPTDDERYLTPLRAKILIYKYIREYFEIL